MSHRDSSSSSNKDLPVCLSGDNLKSAFRNLSREFSYSEFEAVIRTRQPESCFACFLLRFVSFLNGGADTSLWEQHPVRISDTDK